MPYLDPASPPSIFGVSGYSGAGTKSGQKDQDGLPVTLPKVVRVTFSFATYLPFLAEQIFRERKREGWSSRECVFGRLGEGRRKCN